LVISFGNEQYRLGKEQFYWSFEFCLSCDENNTKIKTKNNTILVVGLCHINAVACKLGFDYLVNKK